MYHGSCLCGKIKFTLSGKIDDIVYCHCSQCRKAQGSAFATNANVKSYSFNFICGEENLSSYKYSTEQTKYFCKNCGSPIMSKNINFPENVRIRLGTIESDISERPVAHIFVSSKANWEEISDSLPHYAEYKTNR
ncbi:MAG: GFA family protein [Gammaproteobacteria bacterium]|nr:GFA family protein [Gammaproteobacteria bacterium]MCW8987526.1 GFA family protein [Gammaproteobacteria bacterium]